MAESKMMEGSYYILLRATLLRYNILRRPLTDTTFRDSTSVIQHLAQDKTMEHPSLCYSSDQAPYLDAMNPASHPGTRSTPNHQRDPFSSVASSLNDFQNVHNMNNYLCPGPESFYNTSAQLDDYVMGTEKEWSRSPVNLNVCRTSTTTSSFRYRNVPPEAESSVMDPLHDILTNDQGLGLREQLEACAYGYYPSDFRPQGIVHGRNTPTDAPPSYQVIPQGSGNAHHTGAGTIKYGGENVRPAVSPHQASSTTFDFNYAATPQIFDPSYVSTPVAVSPRIKSEHSEPSRTSTDLGIFTTCCPTWNVTKDIKPESLDTFTPSHHSRNVSELKDFESPTTTPIPRLQRPCRRPIPTPTRSKAVDPSNTATSPSPTPPPSVAGSVDSSTTLIPDRGIEYDPNLKYPQPSNNSVEIESDPDQMFRDFTTFYDNIYLGGGCQMVDLGAPDLPIVKKEHVPDALEPVAAQHDASQPVGDTGLEQKAMPQKQKRKRTTSDAISTETEEYRMTKKTGKKANPGSVPRPFSDDPRRNNPDFIYFCADGQCYASLVPEYAFGGFKTKEDAQRHLLVHEPARFICSLPHRNGKEYCGKRADNFRE